MNKQIPLSELANISAGQSAPQGDVFSMSGTPFIRAGSLLSLINGASEDDLEKVSDELAKKCKLKIQPAGTIIFAKSGMSCMKGYVYVLKKPCYVVSHLACVLPYSGKSGYLKYYLLWNKPNQLIKDEAYPSISLESISNLLIAQHDEQDQDNIVKNLDKVNFLIDKRKEQLRKLDELIKSKFIEMFGDPVRNEMSWATDCMSEVAPINCNKNKIADSAGKYWLLNLDMVEAQTGTVINKFMVEKHEIGFSTTTFSEENVLYSKLRPYLNKVILPDESGYSTTELLPLLPNKSLLNRVFLAYLLRSDGFVSYINEKVAGAKMPRVQMDTLRQFQVILPPLTLQDNFANFVQEVEKTKIKLQQSLEKLEMCYKALMQEYFG